MIEDIQLFNKRKVWALMQAQPEMTPDNAAEVLSAHLPDLVTWHGPHPFYELEGAKALASEFWQPLLEAAPQIQRRTDFFVSGEFDGSHWVATAGYFIGFFTGNWLGIPTAGKGIHLRQNEFYRFEDGRIVEMFTLLDILDVMRQAGYYPVQDAGGHQRLVPGPMGGDGIIWNTPNPDETARTYQAVMDMVDGLARYDGKDLAVMEMHKYWDAERMVWYGPTGIGTCHTLKGFEDHHQRPFLDAFPDRHSFHRANLVAGPYFAYLGWPTLHATFTRPYMGVEPNGKPIVMRGMDWWTRVDDRLVENWVLLDMLHLYKQMGQDLLAMCAEHFAAK